MNRNENPWAYVSPEDREKIDRFLAEALGVLLLVRRAVCGSCSEGCEGCPGLEIVDEVQGTVMDEMLQHGAALVPGWTLVMLEEEGVTTEGKTCPKCGAGGRTYKGDHETAVHRVAGGAVSVVDVGWRCWKCSYEWGFEGPPEAAK